MMAFKMVKKIAKGIMVDAGVEIVRGYVVSRLKPVKPEDFLKAIQEGKHTIGATNETDKNFAHKWTPIMEKLAINGEKLHRDKLTSANVLVWLQKDRPDLAKVIVDCKKQGQEWLDKDVELMFSFLFPPHENKPPAQKTQCLKLVEAPTEESTVKDKQPTAPNIPQIK